MRLVPFKGHLPEFFRKCGVRLPKIKYEAVDLRCKWDDAPPIIDVHVQG
jgi:hypothetical protein